MLKNVKIILVTILILLYTNIGVFAAEPESSGRAAILMDGSSGRVLYMKNAEEKLPMASTTKILTALVALEQGNLLDKVIVPPAAQGVEGSSIWLSAGETHTLEDLLYGLMLRSGNDAATAIALHIGGSLEGFSAMMNQKARSLGAENSHFINPHGLHHDAHYTTARDLALITVHALKNPDFARIVSTQYRTIPWEGHEWDRAMKNKNKLLWQYEGANGVKTGYTKKAGRCLVAAAKRDELQLVAVVLDCGPMFEESSALLNHGFLAYKHTMVVSEGDVSTTLPIVDGKTGELSLKTARGFAIALKDGEEKLISTTLKVPDFVEAPVQPNQQVGSIQVYFDNELMDEIPLLAVNEVEEKQFWDFLKKMIPGWR